MDNSFEPEELFNALRIVKGMKTRYRQDVLEAYDNDLRKLKVQHISQNNQHSQTQSVAPANRLAIVYEGDDVARDSSWCPHRRLWVKPENRSPLVLANLLYTVRASAEKVEEGTALAKRIYSLWSGGKWNTDHKDELLHLMTALEEIDQYIEEKVIGRFQRDIMYLGCTNACGGYRGQVSAGPNVAAPPLASPISAPDAKSKKKAKSLTQSRACQNVADALENVASVWADADRDISMLHHAARLAWEAYDQDQANETVVSNPEVPVDTPSSPPQTNTDPEDIAVPRPPPITTVPEEVLSYVVRDAAVVDPKMRGVVGTVNRYFNNLANDTPSLWSYVHVMSPVPEVTKSLKKSRNAPLHLDFSVAPRYSHEEGLQRLQAFAAELTTCDYNRLQSFQAVTTEPIWSRFAIDLLRTAISPLAQLKAVDIGLTNSFSPSLVLDGFPILGNLTELSVHWIQFQEDTLPTFPRLLKLKVEGSMTTRIQTTFNIIGTMTSLQCLSLQDIHDNSTPETIGPPALLPALTSIEAVRCGTEEISNLFGMITPTNLKSLVVEPWERMPSYERRSLRAAIQPHACGLREFHIVGGSIDNWAPLLSNFTSITHLRIDHSPITDADLTALCGPLEKRNCPNLTHLALYTISTVSSEALKKLVKARHDSGTPIHSLTLSNCGEGNFVDADMEEIDALVKNLSVGAVPDQEAVFEDQDNSMGNISSVDMSWSSADISSSCLMVAPDDWLVGSLSDRWMRMRSGRTIFPTFPNGVQPDPAE